MKKSLALISAAILAGNLYAFDTAASLKPAGSVSEYTKTSFTITQKFGDYYRSPKAKYIHSFDASGREVSSTEMTNKDSLVDRLAYEYDAGGNLVSTTAFDADGKITWKTSITYKDGVKADESEYNASNILVNKSIWKITPGKESEEAFYNADGALLGKTITKFDNQKRDSEVCVYNADGALDEKRIYTYNDAGRLSEVTYYNGAGIQTKKNVYRFDESYAITELQTYNEANKLTQRIIYKYDDKGNVVRETTYAVADKFGGTVNELVDICEYSYNYGSSAATAQPVRSNPSAVAK